MNSILDLIITDADMERMQVEVDQALRLMEEINVDSHSENPDWEKSD